MPLLTPPDYIKKELKLIDRGLRAEWSDRKKQWMIFMNGEINRWVQDDDRNPRPLDQRLIRKIRVDLKFTKSPKALDAYLENDHFALLAYTERGLYGVSDYLAGY